MTSYLMDLQLIQPMNRVSVNLPITLGLTLWRETGPSFLSISHSPQTIVFHQNYTIHSKPHDKAKNHAKANWNEPLYKNLQWCNLNGSHIKYLPCLKIYLWCLVIMCHRFWPPNRSTYETTSKLQDPKCQLHKSPPRLRRSKQFIVSTSPSPLGPTLPLLSPPRPHALSSLRINSAGSRPTVDNSFSYAAKWAFIQHTVIELAICNYKKNKTFRTIQVGFQQKSKFS